MLLREEVKRAKPLIVASIILIVITTSILLYISYPKGDKIDEAVSRGYSFLTHSLWDDEVGAYRECPSPNPEGKDKNYWGDDNYLAYIFHTEYFEDAYRADKIRGFLHTSPLRLEEGIRRWIVLSSNFTEYEPYNNTLYEYADQITLDGIYYAMNGDLEVARMHFNILIQKWYDLNTGLIFDKATLDGEGRQYYKVALALILARRLNNSTYINLFTDKLVSLQRADGSWLTDDKWGSRVYPNAETTILILLALRIMKF